MISGQKCQRVTRSPYQGNAQYPHQTSIEVESSVAMLLWLVGAEWLGGEMTGNRCNFGRFAQRRFAPCKIFYSGFHAVRWGFQILDSGFQLLAGFLIHWAEFLIFQRRGFRIPQAQISQTPGFISKKLNFSRFRNPYCRTQGKTSHPDLSWLADYIRHLVLPRDIILVKVRFSCYDCWEKAIDLNSRSDLANHIWGKLYKTEVYQVYLKYFMEMFWLWIWGHIFAVPFPLKI